MTINHTYVIIAFLTSLIFSLILTPLVIKICNTKGLYDEPDARKVHKQAIPRLGGTLFLPSLGIGVAVASIVMYNDRDKEMMLNASSLIILAGAMLIYLIGILDDLKGMKATQKFAIQTVAAMLFPLCNLMINNLHGIFGLYEIPIWASYPLTVFVILLIVNAMNLIDGIDGLASSLSIIILGAYSYLYAALNMELFSLISISLAGAVLAFFIYNVFGKVGRLKIFMGDSGSLVLGYVIAYLAIKYQMDNECGGFPFREESLLTSFSLVFIPCIDVIRVALQRKINGKKMFDPDKTHLHHCIMAMGLDMHQTLLVIITLFAVICSINYGLYVVGVSTVLIILTDIAIYSIFIGAVNVFKNQKD